MLPAQLYLQEHSLCWRLLLTWRPLSQRVCRGKWQLSQNECVSAVVSDDECVSLSLDLPARNWASVTTHQESINQLCSLQITGSYRPDGNFTLEHPAAQVWLTWRMLTLVCTLCLLAGFFFFFGMWVVVSENESASCFKGRLTFTSWMPAGYLLF